MRASGPLLSLCLVLLAACTTVETTGGTDVSKGNRQASEQARRLVDEMRFMHGQELLQRMNRLTSMGPEATAAVVEGSSSDDWLVRASCAWILGAAGDRRHIPTLRDRLKDEVAAVRYQAASSLVRLGDDAGFATLVEGLSDEDLQNRFKCFQALRTVTGQDFGYRHDATPEERRPAVARWNDWLAGLRASAL